jgi:hypothetical protein
MTILTLEDLSAKLVELESHPGREHLRRYAPTGVTAQRWAVVDAMLGQLWNDLADQSDDLEQANSVYPEVEQFFNAVDEINTTVVKQLAPLLKRIDAGGGPVPKEVTDLLGISASDPLFLTANDIDARIAAITEVVAFQANWPAAIAETAISLDALCDAVKHAAQIRERATKKVMTGPLPVAANCVAKLRAELDSIEAPDPTALRELQQRIASALQRVRQDEALAQGLLDRRAELRGRLKAYAAKAARLGLGEDPDLLSSRGTASGLLTHQPCDLRAATQAVVDYQQMLAGKRETSR